MTDKRRRLVRELAGLRGSSYGAALAELRELGPEVSWRAYVDRVAAVLEPDEDDEPVPTERDRLAAQVARLREALRPFAESEPATELRGIDSAIHLEYMGLPVGDLTLGRSTLPISAFTGAADAMRETEPCDQGTDPHDHVDE